MIWAAVSWYCAGPIIALNGRITASDYVDSLSNQVYPVVQMLLPNNDAIFQDDDSPITQPELFSLGLRSVEMHFKYLPCPAQLPDLNIVELLWSVVESMVRSRFPSPSLKQLRDVLHEEWYSAPLETLQNLHELFKEGYRPYYRQTVAQLLINKEMCLFHDCFHLFLSIPCAFLCAQYVRYVHNCTEYSYMQFGSLNDFS